MRSQRAGNALCFDTATALRAFRNGLDDAQHVV
jgi:hypothetical protein